jgi:hypothetical protein
MFRPLAKKQRKRQIQSAISFKAAFPQRADALMDAISDLLGMVKSFSVMHT